MDRASFWMFIFVLRFFGYGVFVIFVFGFGCFLLLLVVFCCLCRVYEGVG